VLRFVRLRAMRPAGSSESAARGVAGPGTEGVVSRPSPWRRWRSTTSAGGSSWPAAGTPMRWPRSGPPSSWPAAAGRALERALDLAEPDGRLLWFMLYPAPDLLERRARQRTAHAALIAQILDLLAGPGACGGMAFPPAGRAAQPPRAPRAALPADPPVGAGDRQRAVRPAHHGQDPPAPPVRQARRAHPGPNGSVRRPGLLAPFARSPAPA
jgi:hypothetical protein